MPHYRTIALSDCRFVALSLLFAVALFFAFPAFAESPYQTIWTKQIGSSSSDHALGIAADSSGNTYVTGITYGSLDGNTNEGGYDLFLVKHDVDGNRLWTRQIGTSSNDYAYGAAVDGSGNVYVTGGTYGSLDANTNAGGYDVFLVKYDANGNKLWTRQMGTSSDDIAYGVASDSNGNVYIAGGTYGGLGGCTSAGEYDIFLVKYDSDGNKLWTRQAGTSSDDIAYGVAVDGNGDVYVTSGTYGSFDYNTNSGGYDIFLVKYDSNGKKLWTSQTGTSSDDIAYGIAVDSNGNVYVSGTTYGSLDGNTNAGEYDIFLIKYDLNGNKLWTRQMGTSSDDITYGVAVDNSGNAYITGWTYDSLDGNITMGDADLFLIKYDSNGNKLWTSQTGTSSADYALGVALESGGDTYVTGITYGSLDGNANAGGLDVFVMKLGIDTTPKTPDISITITPPTTATVSNGGKLGPFSILIKNNTHSNYTFYAYVYLGSPDGTWKNLLSKSLTLSKDRTLSINSMFLNIPISVQAGTYTYYVSVLDTGYNLLDDDSFSFTVSSSSKSWTNDRGVAGWEEK
ncbi:MAG: SBBP repeat-containing protein [Nitrospirae bacterium]|nr:SBBP repeat-containing protein [Nitrospirota bacterium]